MNRFLVILICVLTAMFAAWAIFHSSDRAAKASLQSISLIAESAQIDRAEQADRAFRSSSPEVAIWVLEDFLKYLDTQPVLGLAEKKHDFYLFLTHGRLSTEYKRVGDLLLANKHMTNALKYAQRTFKQPPRTSEDVTNFIENFTKMDRAESRFSTNIPTQR
jgi:hypothetical protein